MSGAVHSDPDHRLPCSRCGFLTPHVPTASGWRCDAKDCGETVPYDDEPVEEAASGAESAPTPDDPDTRTNSRKPARLRKKVVRQGTRTTPGQTPALALSPDILGEFRSDLARAGVAGEERLAQILYLAVTSRMLPWGRPNERPVSVIPKGTSSTGKSHATRTVLAFFPESAYFDLGSMSRRYLFYTEESFEHRFIYVPEWASIKDDEELVALVRVLLSEGRIVHGTVEGEGRRKGRRIEKTGPTGLLITTTDAGVDAELETRCLSVVTDDSPQQTRAVYEALAALEDEREPLDFSRWHEFQDWIAAHGETQVYLPFVAALAQLMPATATRLRRDFVTVLCLIRAHAIVYRAQRELDGRGRIVATVEGDYAPVRDLVADLIAEGVEAGVSEAMRETVEAVRSLREESGGPVSPAALVKPLGIGRSATYDRVNRALRSGYLVNEAARGERKKLALGTPLPGGDAFLPPAEEIVRYMSGRPPGQSSGSTMRPGEGLSGCPGRPADPPDEDDVERLAEIARQALGEDGDGVE